MTLEGTLRTVRRIGFWGTPLALAGGLYLMSKFQQQFPLRLTVTPQAIEQAAAEFAATHGMDTKGWRFVTSANADASLDSYYKKQGQLGQVRLAEEIVARIPVLASMTRPDGKRWFRLQFAPNGKVVGYRLGGDDRPSYAAAGGGATYQALAEAETRRSLPPGLKIDLGQPEIQKLDSRSDPEARRFLWRADMPEVPGLDINFTAEVEGGTVIRMEPSPQLEERFNAQTIEPIKARQKYFSIIRLILIVTLVGYGCYRYVRRRMEREAARGRMVAIALFVVGFALLLLAVEPNMALAGSDPERMTGTFLWIGAVAFLGSLAVQGLLLGLCYAAAEGDIREAYPGKLTALDAALTGRLFSQNVGRSTLAGFSVASWTLLGLAATLMALGTSAQFVLLMAVSFTYFGSLPGLMLIFNLPIVALMGAVLGLALPLTFASRHVNRGWRRLVILLLCGVFLIQMGEQIDPSNLSQMLIVLGCLTAAAGAFFLWDFLAAIAALAGFLFLVDVAILVGLSPVWRGTANHLGWVALATVAFLTIAARWGRRYSDEDVRPQYARNLQVRLAMQAELSAAREAQLRLLPDAPPRIPGIQIAASCVPANEVGGDYYDFFPLTGGRLGLAIAEGGNDGLASALTIALAKGALLCEAERGLSPADTLSSVSALIGDLLVRESGITCLLYAVIDPHHQTLAVARSGEYPHLLRVHPDGGIETVKDGTIRLTFGETLLFYTDGFPKELERQHQRRDPQAALQSVFSLSSGKTAQGVHDDLRKLVLPGTPETDLNLRDDLTTVVIRMEERLSAELEQVA